MAPRIPLTRAQVEAIKKLRYEDGLAAAEVAARLGLHTSTVLKRAPGRPGKIPVGPVRAIFLESGLNAPQVALQLGWTCRGKGDGARLRRALGLIASNAGNGHRTPPERRGVIDAEAGLIAEACGRQRWEVEPQEAPAA